MKLHLLLFRSAANSPADILDRVREKGAISLPVVTRPEIPAPVVSDVPPPKKDESQAATVSIAGMVHLGSNGPPVGGVEIDGQGCAVR